jgi:hypothetical protein
MSYLGEHISLFELSISCTDACTGFRLAFIAFEWTTLERKFPLVSGVRHIVTETDYLLLKDITSLKIWNPWTRKSLLLSPGSEEIREQ